MDGRTNGKDGESHDNEWIALFCLGLFWCLGLGSFYLFFFLFSSTSFPILSIPSCFLHEVYPNMRLFLFFFFFPLLFLVMDKIFTPDCLFRMF